MAITYMAIKTKLRKPDQILLIYPALALTLEHNWNPSHIFTLEETILSPPLTKICLSSYCTEEESKTNMYASPMFAPDDILRELPPVKICCGDRDPLRDDTVRFLERLR